MGFAAATTAAFLIWIVLWAIGAKGFDAFMVTLLVIIVAATVKIAIGYLPGSDRERR
jgi:hypothetical protein